ncbi:hypothetical protein LTR56_026920 [Elasticomyces elasticus]|nr:hypothetical protein LTR56_026920 [Elasticomyces elasticus]KAK3636580.1 hypothetical protein LTR22_018685 [Elasticomyces elasticus]KAK4897059.1 hypothetical protein LTR49_028053 [Elasticomyces elasticus]KAK5735137.1 hypothetical protein LTS12_026536 [Elasticomyces elasticus]
MSTLVGLEHKTIFCAHLVHKASRHRTSITPSTAAHAPMAVTNKMAPKLNAGRLYSDIVTGRSAATQVFGTFELCEIIIQELAPFDLIRISGLNHVTRAVIADSTKMQETLFLKSIPDNECKLWALNRWGDLIAGDKANQVLEATDADNKDPTTMSESTRLQVTFEITHAFSPHIVNNLVLHHLPSWQYGPIVAQAYEFVHDVHGRSKSITVAYWLLNRTLSPHASCRAMYLSQPPVNRIFVTVYRRCNEYTHAAGGHKNFVAKFTISNSTGLTFGEVIDRVRYEQQQNPDYHPDSSGVYFSFEDGMPVKDAYAKARVQEVGLVDGRDPW